MQNQVNRTKVVTGIVRLSYANVWNKKSVNGGAEKYSVSLIIPKTDAKTLTEINAAVDAAYEEGKSKFGAKFPMKTSLKLPLRDGDLDRSEDEAYRGSYFVNANSNDAPQIVDQNVNPILDQSEVYSGVYARVSINFYAFDSNGNRGIACGLGNIQKVRDGEPLTTRSTATDDFGGMQSAAAPAYAPPAQPQYTASTYPQPQYTAPAYQQPQYAPAQPYQQPQSYGPVNPLTGQPMGQYGA